jgi:hypothetical protein
MARAHHVQSTCSGVKLFRINIQIHRYHYQQYKIIRTRMIMMTIRLFDVDISFSIDIDWHIVHDREAVLYIFLYVIWVLTKTIRYLWRILWLFLLRVMKDADVTSKNSSKSRNHLDNDGWCPLECHNLRQMFFPVFLTI